MVYLIYRLKFVPGYQFTPGGHIVSKAVQAKLASPQRFHCILTFCIHISAKLIIHYFPHGLFKLMQQVGKQARAVLCQAPACCS